MGSFVNCLKYGSIVVVLNPTKLYVVAMSKNPSMALGCDRNLIILPDFRAPAETYSIQFINDLTNLP